MQETWVWSLDREDPLEKKMATHSSILACILVYSCIFLYILVCMYSILTIHGKYHGQRNLPSYSPCGHKKSGMTEQLSTQACMYHLWMQIKNVCPRGSGFINLALWRIFFNWKKYLLIYIIFHSCIIWNSIFWKSSVYKLQHNGSCACV